MVERHLNDWLARGRFALANPPWLALAAGLLVLVAGGLQLFALPARLDAIEAAEQQLRQLDRAARRAAIERQLAPASPERSRMALLEQFSDDARRHTDLGRLLELADSAGLALAAGEYRLVAGEDRLFDRYVLNLPVQGSYHDLRRYLATVRAEFPALAVEDISLRRENIASNRLDAQLRLVIFVRPPETR